MKTLDYVGEKVKAAVATVSKAMAAGAAKPARSRDAQEELDRRASVNARAAAIRADREAAIFGHSRWLPPTSNWLNRGR